MSPEEEARIIAQSRFDVNEEIDGFMQTRQQTHRIALEMLHLRMNLCRVEVRQIPDESEDRWCFQLLCRRCGSFFTFKSEGDYCSREETVGPIDGCGVR